MKKNNRLRRGIPLTLLVLFGCAHTIDITKYNDVIISNLAPREYVISKEVFDDFQHTFGEDDKIGVYLNSEVDYNKNKDKFLENLSDNGYSKEKLEWIVNNIYRKGNILVSEDAIKKKNFSETIAHEKYHKEYEALSPVERSVLENTCYKMRENLFEITSKWNRGPKALLSFQMLDPKEFYAYLVGGMGDEEVKEKLLEKLKNYKEAYDIHMRLYNKVVKNNK